MGEQRGSRPDVARVDRVEGEVAVFTRCHGARVLFAPEQAILKAPLCVVCPRDGIEWGLELVTDEAAESGLRAVWTDPEPQL
ncbi:MAG: hypothetical protein ACRDYA_12915 [Egibacteraceae bacterium]